ncbi:MAG: hypothetical protein R3C10_26440 [Pirellulales bacterium]
MRHRPIEAAAAAEPFIPAPRWWPGWLDWPGLLLGITMCGQISIVVLASHLIRTVGDPDSFVRGLRSLRVAPLFAYSLDISLALISGAEMPKQSREDEANEGIPATTAAAVKLNNTAVDAASDMIETQAENGHRASALPTADDDPSPPSSGGRRDQKGQGRGSGSGGGRGTGGGGGPRRDGGPAESANREYGEVRLAPSVHHKTVESQTNSRRDDVSMERPGPTIGPGSDSGSNTGRGGGRGQGGGRGDGSGGGRGESGSGVRGGMAFWSAIRHRDLTPLANRIQDTLAAAEQRALDYGLDKQRAHDVAVIGAVGAVMMSLKLVKIMPGLPVMAGMKSIFFIPLYIIAAEATRSRWGATVAGTIMGLIAFLNGDGRYGIFEVFKHTAPGFLIDLFWPLLSRFPRKLWVFVVMGVIAAIGRTSSELIMTIALAGGAELYVFPLWKAVPNLIAGVLSSYVALGLIKALMPERGHLIEDEPVEAPAYEPEESSTDASEVAGSSPSA